MQDIMTLNKYKEIILNTLIENWTNMSCWGSGAGPSYKDKMTVWMKGNNELHSIDVDSHSEVYSLKTNLLISIAVGITHNDNFVEEWANSFPDPKASSAYIDFFYANQLIFRDIYVSIDGGRCRIPLPDLKVNDKYEIEGYTVPKEKYEFYKILFGSGEGYDSYFSRTKIKIIDEPWMI